MNITDAIKRLQAVFNSAVDGIVIIDDLGLIEEVNTSTCNLFGYKAEELIGKNVSMLMPETHSKNHDQYISAYKETRKPKIIGIGREVTGLKKNGDIFPFWLAVSEVKLDDRTIFTGFIHDLSEIKQAENRLKSLNDDLENKVVARTYELENVVNKLLSLNKQYESEIKNRIEAQNELKQRKLELEKSLEKEKELGELKTRFVSMASHEFRTPLSTIQSSVSLIGRYTEPEQQSNREKHINKIKSSVTHLTGILNDFLSMNKLEEGKVTPVIEAFDPAVLCNEVIDELKGILKNNQNLFKINNLTVETISSDRKILKNIMINLLSNAIKYSKDDGQIKCELANTEEYFIMRITDTGIGIPEEDQKHLFDKFFRAKNAINIEGTGLGLNIVKRYVSIIQGNISFESTLNVGSKFTVQLPEWRSDKLN